MHEIPKFDSCDAYCAHVQTLIRDELSELLFSFASDKKAAKIIGQRIAELDQQIAMLITRTLVK
jgi:hypothetical protein